MMNLTPFGSSYILYREAVRSELVKADAYPSPEWFRAKYDRINRAFIASEPVDMLVAELREFAIRYRPPRKTPKQLAKRYVVVQS